MGEVHESETFKMTEETPKIPAIEEKSPTKRVETSNIKNKTLVNDNFGVFN